MFMNNMENSRKRKVDTVICIENEPKITDEKKHSETANAGFAAYAKSNPFLNATKILQSEGGSFGKGFGSKHSIPPIIIPSPKSPKNNPFSSTSPVHNPFVTIVEGNDDLWSFVKKDRPQEHKTEIVGEDELSSKRQKISTEVDISLNSDNQQPEKCDTLEANILPRVEEAKTQTTENNSVFFSPVPQITGEESDECLLHFRVKLYKLKQNLILDSDDVERKANSNDMEWIEIGVGPLKVLQENKSDEITKKSRLVMRREDKKGGIGTKLILNIPITKFTKVAKQGDKIIRILGMNFADNISDSSTLKTYLFKVKCSEDCDNLLKLLKTLQEVAG